MRLTNPTTGGFTLVELVVVMAIIAALGCTSAISCARYIDRTRVQRARAELNLMAADLDVYYSVNGAYPNDPSLACIKWPQVGPWGREYEYEKNASGYVLVVSDGEGRKRVEARGAEGSSEVFEFTAR
ncbi:type IV pilin protein [Desulfofundulus sp.]|uniref:type IV pilin protein n=1 Tax=Desulfofundulus sp. TaxID=2282750 RepID=UPI003C73FF08